MKYLISLILCNICLFVTGQTKYYVQQIKVTDSSNNPVEYANVALYLQKDTSLIYGGITNKDGILQFEEIKENSYILRISYIGYEDYETEFVPKGNKNDHIAIVLKKSEVALNEVTVVGHKPIISMKNGILTTGVANSLLSTLGTADDVLRHIPGLVANQDGYTVFGKGTPVIYIDNRKVRDNTELIGISSENILKIELITNPGAEYDAETRSVLKIITNKKKENGFSMSLYGNARQGYEFGHKENIELNYHYKGFNVFAMYGYTDRKWQEKYNLDYLVTSDTIWNQKSSSKYKKSTHWHTLTTGLQYELNKKHSLGAQYRYSTNDFKNASLSSSYQLYANNNLIEDVVTDGPYLMDNKQHQLNMFYQGKFSEHLNMQVDIDYFGQNLNTFGETNETSVINGRKISSITENSNQFRVYAGKGILNQKINENLSFQYGTEYSLVNGNGTLLSNAVANNDFSNRESKIAAFASTDLQINNLSMQLGLRYEYVRSEADEYGKQVVNRKYSDFFPSLGLSLPVGNVDMSLNFSNRVSRPSFSILNNNMQYIDRFHQEIGNPFLKPEKIYDLDYSIGYKFLKLRFNYQYVKDYIALYTEPSEVTSAVTLTSFTNFPKYQELGATLIAEHNIGCWTPSFSAGVYKQLFSTDMAGFYYKYGKPSLDLSLDNYISLPWNMILNIDMYYCTGGNMGMKLYEDYGNIDVGLRKSFLKENLVLSLWGYDLFGWRRYSTEQYLGKLYTGRYADQDNRYATLTVTWKFNNFKNKYKGKGAANDVKMRL